MRHRECQNPLIHQPFNSKYSTVLIVAGAAIVNNVVSNQEAHQQTEELKLDIVWSVWLEQPSGSAHGQASDIKIHAEEILKMRKILNAIYATHTKQPIEVCLSIVFCYLVSTSFFAEFNTFSG
ncbi:hypothetical protein AHF37_03921 [Paragonimus kellicotti]|nr:hypothetical protein AHF37_03921 [Paragonimus kellicotti]